MPLNPHLKGGADIPIADGGTGASDAATGISNLGGLDTTAHASLNHAGIPGVGDLTTAAHSALDHSGITGVGGTPLGNGSLGAASGTISVPADTVSSPGEFLQFFIGYTNAANNNTITATFGTTVLNASIDNASSSFEGWEIKLIYQGGSTWRYLVRGYGDQARGDDGETGTATADPTSVQTFTYSKSGGGEVWTDAVGFAATG